MAIRQMPDERAAHANVRWCTNPTHMIANAIGMTSGETNQGCFLAILPCCEHSALTSLTGDWSLGHRRVGSTYSANHYVYMGRRPSIYEARPWVLHSFSVIAPVALRPCFHREEVVTAPRLNAVNHARRRGAPGSSCSTKPPICSLAASAGRSARHRRTVGRGFPTADIFRCLRPRSN
jgi:hypothetical protein